MLELLYPVMLGLGRLYLLKNMHEGRKASAKVFFLLQQGFGEKNKVRLSRDSNVQVSTFHSFSKRLIEEKLTVGGSRIKNKIKAFGMMKSLSFIGN